MKTQIIILCAVAALAGCSRQGGTGTERHRTYGSSTNTEDTTTITNRGTNFPNTNRFGTSPGAGSDYDRSKPDESKGAGTP